MPVLEVENISKAWPGLEVRVSFSVGRGETLALLGHSGCGKSTILRMLAGLLAPDSGCVRTGGTDVTAKPPRDRGIGMVFQDLALFPHLDVARNVGYGLSCRGIPRAERERVSGEMLAKVGLGGFGKRKVQSLSGGERQRVALARTLAANPAAVLFDEPLSSVDVALRKSLREEIRRTVRELGLSAVYVTHDVEEAFRVADRVAVMEAGKILRVASPRELWEDPVSAAAARFLGSGPLFPIEGAQPAGPDGLEVLACGNRILVPIGGEAAPETARWLYFPRSAASLRKNGGETPGSASIRALCLGAEFSGDSVDCLLEAGGCEFRIRLPADADISEGKAVELAVPPVSMKLLY